MKMSFISRMIQRMTFLGLVIGLVLVGLASGQATAQVADGAWTLPVNLSQSGLTTSPALVVDESGVTHVFWLDQLEGVVYTRESGEQWDIPLKVDPPFETDTSEETEDNAGNKGGSSSGKDSENTSASGEQNLSVDTPFVMFAPSLVADQAGQIHAFWINAENELFYSSVVTEDLANNGWSTAVNLAETVQDFDVFIDSFNHLLENRRRITGLIHCIV